MTASAASASGAAGRGPSVTLAPPVADAQRRAGPAAPPRCARIQALSSGAYAATMRRADVGHVGHAREVDVRGAPAGLARAAPAWASSRLVLP